MNIKHHTNKVGIVPYIWRDGACYFLIHLPKAKNASEQNQMIWGLARGTVESGDDSPECTALREAEEELGLRQENIEQNSLRAHGVHLYDSSRKAAYPITWFSAAAKNISLETLRAQATDTYDIAWKSYGEIEHLATQGQFKPGYLPILQTIASAITPPV